MLMSVALIVADIVCHTNRVNVMRWQKLLLIAGASGIMRARRLWTVLIVLLRRRVVWRRAVLQHRILRRCLLAVLSGKVLAISTILARRTDVLLLSLRYGGLASRAKVLAARRLIRAADVRS